MLLPPLSSSSAGTEVEALQARLVALTAWLAEWREVWSGRAFQEQPVPWEARLPELSAWLHRRPEAEVEQHEAAPEHHPDAHPLLVEWARQSRVLCALPGLGLVRQGTSPPRRVSVRKWAQIQSFLGALAPQPPAMPVDWCAGKGHLGRSLALACGQEVHAVERDAALCRSGAALAERAGAAMHFHVADVLHDPLDRIVTPGRTVIALHACGDLGTRALTLAAERDCAGVALAPCCFHRLAAPAYQPLSATGRSQDLRLSRDELRLPSSEEVVASDRMRRLRRREMRFRLTVDRLLRDHTGVDRYTTLHSVPEAWTNGGLVDFVARVSMRDGLGLAPSDVQLAVAERWATERARVVRALGMTRAAFRRPLELWVALDRALFLAERGWAVRLGTFCPHRTTPRNILIAATRLRPRLRPR